MNPRVRLTSESVDIARGSPSDNKDSFSSAAIVVMRAPAMLWLRVNETPDSAHTSANRERLRIHCKTVPPTRSRSAVSVRLDRARALRRREGDGGILVEFAPVVAASFQNFLDVKESQEELFHHPVDLPELPAVRNLKLRHYIEQS
jgi:predicted nucleotidyltransferase